MPITLSLFHLSTGSISPPLSISHSPFTADCWCFIVLYYALLCFYHCILRIDLLIYSAQQLQECLINLLTYLTNGISFEFRVHTNSAQRFFRFSL